MTKNFISYDCSELLERIKQDCANYRRTKIVYALFEMQDGVKVIYDYTFDLKELNKQAQYEKTTLGKILAYVTRLNNPTNNYSSINDLFDASGMSNIAFARYFDIPLRTIESWLDGTNNIAPYLLDLLNYKLINEGLVCLLYTSPSPRDRG